MAEQHQLLPMGIGERLTQVRERRGLSRESVAAALHIPVDIVAAIEAEDLERFAPVYRRGYVKSYAQHLEMPKPEIDGLLTAMASDDPEVHALFPGRGKAGPADRWLKATSYVLASLLIGTLAWQFTHEAVRLTQGKGRPAAIDTAGDAERAVPAPSGTGADGARHVNASIAALEQMRLRGDSADPAAQAWSALQTAARPAPHDLPPLAAGEHLLAIRTSGDSWVEITDAQGHQLELDLLRGGSDKQYRGIAPFKILFGMASAVELSLDGQPVDTRPFTNQGVAQMTLAAPPREGSDD